MMIRHGLHLPFRITRPSKLVKVSRNLLQASRVSVALNREGVSKWVGQGHRDDVVGDRFAVVLSQRTGGTVCAACGMHYESVTEGSPRYQS